MKLYFCFEISARSLITVKLRNPFPQGGESLKKHPPESPFKRGLSLNLMAMSRSLMLIFSVIIMIISGLISDCLAHDDSQALESPIDFTMLSLEELKNVEIISVSKKPEKVSEVPTAVFVITQEDIQRSGATSIADALRMAPGVQVARTELHEWAVTVRSLNGEFSDGLLVMIDGRSVYTPVFSGVFWDVQDTVTEDIERIEVIRGPGAAVWGANAVSGVINIITKHAKDTTGFLFQALGGTGQNNGSVRYGDSVGDETHYRTYIKYFKQDRPDGNDPSTYFWQDDTADNWHSVRGGFRLDHAPGTDMGSDSFTIQGEAYSNRYDTEFNNLLLYPPYRTKQTDVSKAEGCHIIGRWEHMISETSDTVLQLYYDHARKDYDPGASRINTVDLELRHRFAVFPRHDIVWGMGYRFIADDFFIKGNIDNFQISVNPEQLDQNIFSAFVQDKIQMLQDRLVLNIGSKFEYSDYNGFELQPSVRILWTLGEKHAVWGAISKAVRTPSRIERSLNAIVDVVGNMHEISPDYIPVSGMARVMGNDDLNPEKLLAYEAGYRMEPTNSLFLDITAFYNNYDNLIVSSHREDILKAEPFLHYMIPFYSSNSMRGESWGCELAADWQAAPLWRLRGTYSYLKTRLVQIFTDQYIIKNFGEKSNPSHQFSLRSSLDITKQLKFDLWFRYVDNLSENNIKSYTTLDARVAWNPFENLELSLVGQNLLERFHKEFSFYKVERGGYFKVTWRF
ncbi:MAG: TonB-dependent receptor [Desulfobacterales bacterium]|nr:TonB-dependent receptor [Desulfobacterales bacterium]